MTHGSLFSGIGGFDLAAEWMGWQNVFHCEWNTFGQKVLKYYWPDAISYNDITQTDFTIHRGRIDILTGGFPCQPYSMAGKRLGKEDDRHLWPEMLRAIREIQPRWVVGENVLGLVNWNGGLVFDEVQADLEAEGYEVQAFVLPASAVNAPHRRDRVWFVAHASNNGFHATKNGQSNRKGNDGDQAREVTVEQFEGRCGATAKSGGDAADTDSRRLEGSVEVGRNGEYVIGENGTSSQTGNATDTGNKRLQGDKFDGASDAGKREQGFSHSTTSKLHKISNWEQFPTVSPICSRNDGISDRLDGITFPKWRQESIKAGGNAVVPQVVLQIFKAIAEYEELIIQRPSV